MRARDGPHAAGSARRARFSSRRIASGDRISFFSQLSFKKRSLGGVLSYPEETRRGMRGFAGKKQTEVQNAKAPVLLPFPANGYICAESGWPHEKGRVEGEWGRREFEAGALWGADRPSPKNTPSTSRADLRGALTPARNIDGSVCPGRSCPVQCSLGHTVVMSDLPNLISIQYHLEIADLIGRGAAAKTPSVGI